VSRTVGIEIAPSAVRAVVLAGWRSTAQDLVEFPWDSNRPQDAVRLLQEKLGPVSRIALSIGLGFLHVKHVKLPPAAGSIKRRMVALEPDRFFAVQDEALAIAVTESDIAFAVPAALLNSWVAAFEAWAPVVSIEPAPISVTRAVGRALTGSFTMPAGAGERGMIELIEGRLRQVRRIPAGERAPVSAPLPSADGVTAGFVAALGAARAINASLHTMLLSDALERRFQTIRTGRTAMLAGACALSVIFALWSIDHTRNRKLQGIENEVAAVEQRASRALELRTSIANADRETAALTEIARTRTDPLEILQALSERLPKDAVVLNMSASDDEWQIDGTAQNAAALIPVLDRDDRFADLRFLSASSRFQELNRTYETFSIGFRVRNQD
jgi:hypothetical protein